MTFVVSCTRDDYAFVGPTVGYPGLLPPRGRGCDWVPPGEGTQDIRICGKTDYGGVMDEEGSIPSFTSNT